MYFQNLITLFCIVTSVSYARPVADNKDFTIAMSVIGGVMVLASGVLVVQYGPKAVKALKGKKKEYKIDNPSLTTLHKDLKSTNVDYKDIKVNYGEPTKEVSEEELQEYGKKAENIMSQITQDAQPDTTKSNDDKKVQEAKPSVEDLTNGTPSNNINENSLGRSNSQRTVYHDALEQPHTKSDLIKAI
jgi:hypothetical protein